MRVVFFDHCARMSGAEIALLNTVPSLAGITSFVILGENGPLVSEMESAGIDVSVVTMNAKTREFDRNSVGFSLGAMRQALSVIKYSIKIAREIRNYNPDVVVSNSMKSHVIISVASLWFRTPVLFHVRDRVSTDFMSRGGVFLERKIMKLIPRGIIANSRSTLATVPKSRRQRIRSVVASPILEPSYSFNTRVSKASSISLGIVGRLTGWKGQELAIRSFAEAFPQGQATLEIVGGPLFGEEDYENFLRSLSIDLNISSRIIFSGHVHDVYERMRNWDILVHCSIIPEPFGQVVVQGMAAGLAVIASGEGGPLETIEHQNTGYLFEPRNQRSLVTAMRELADDAAGRKRLGANARQASRRYLPSEIGVQMRQAISATSGLETNDPSINN